MNKRSYKKRTGGKNYRDWKTKYNTYLEKHEANEQRTLMNEAMSFETFKAVYSKMKDENMKNIIRTMVKADELVSYSTAKDIAKSSDGQYSARDIMHLDLSDYIGREQLIPMKNGREVKHKMSKANAFFAKMADLGYKDIANEYYGY